MEPKASRMVDDDTFEASLRELRKAQMEQIRLINDQKNLQRILEYIDEVPESTRTYSSILDYTNSLKGENLATELANEGLRQQLFWESAKMGMERKTDGT